MTSNLNTKKERFSILILTAFFVFFLANCNNIQSKTEQYISENIKEELINTVICEDGSETIKIIDVSFDNNPDDNSGTKLKLNGIATISNDVEREILIEGDLTDKKDWKFTLGDETQNSMQKRLIQLLVSCNFNSISVLSGESSAPELISFNNNNTGYYISRDGDRYSFTFSIDNATHVNDFPKTSDCNKIVESTMLDEQAFESSFTMENQRFILNGKIEIDGRIKNAIIKATIESKESSRSEEIEWALHSD